MFEKYTEGARGALFFARWEAGQAGASEIEPEHLLLGLMRQTILFGGAAGAIRGEIAQNLPHDIKPVASVDMPVANSLKRALAYAAEESEKANHRHLGVEHLLVGLLRESEPIAALLRKYGIDREKILRESPPEPDEADREALRALVEKLPESGFRRAKRMLEHMQNWPSVPAPMSSPFPGAGVGDATGWRTSTTRIEDGAEVFETHHFHRGHEITLLERYRMSEDGRKLLCELEISGPGHAEKHTIEFDVD